MASGELPKALGVEKDRTCRGADRRQQRARYLPRGLFGLFRALKETLALRAARGAPHGATAAMATMGRYDQRQGDKRHSCDGDGSAKAGGDEAGAAAMEPGCTPSPSSSTSSLPLFLFAMLTCG